MGSLLTPKELKNSTWPLCYIDADEPHYICDNLALNNRTFNTRSVVQPKIYAKISAVELLTNVTDCVTNRAQCVCSPVNCAHSAGVVGALGGVVVMQLCPVYCCLCCYTS